MANNRPISDDQNAEEDHVAIPNRPRYRTNGHCGKVGMPGIGTFTSVVINRNASQRQAASQLRSITFALARAASG